MSRIAILSVLQRLHRLLAIVIRLRLPINLRMSLASICGWRNSAFPSKPFMSISTLLTFAGEMD